jgi:hypothetical protein
MIKLYQDNINHNIEANGYHLIKFFTSLGKIIPIDQVQLCNKVKTFTHFAIKINSFNKNFAYISMTSSKDTLKNYSIFEDENYVFDKDVINIKGGGVLKYTNPIYIVNIKEFSKFFLLSQRSADLPLFLREEENFIKAAYELTLLTEKSYKISLKDNNFLHLKATQEQIAYGTHKKKENSIIYSQLTYKNDEMKSLLYPDSLNIISGEDIEACMKDHEKL